MSVRDKLLVLDFDGTLCLGEDPVLAYAEQVDTRLAATGRATNLPRPVRQIVAEAFATDSLLAEDITYTQAGHPTAVTPSAPSARSASGAGLPSGAVSPGAGSAAVAPAHPVAWPLQDGYQLVQLLATQAGLPIEESSAAFRAARDSLVTAGLEHTDLHAPAGARRLLAALRREVVVVLITNSPAAGFTPWLETLGLQEAFDAVINDARKPFGMPEALDSARKAAPAPIDDTAICSVGDIWGNDLAHVHARGGTTVLIDRFSTGLGTPDHRVRSWAEAAPILSAWAGLRHGHITSAETES